MNRFRKLTSELLLASFVAFGPTVQAKGPGTGGGRSNQIVCGGLLYLYNLALSAGLTDQADDVKAYAASIPCEWAQ